MEPFTRMIAVAAPIDIVNCDTDRIIPARFLRKAREPGYERWLFHDMRFDAQGNERPDFILNQAPYRNAKILVAAANYGCGSSREQAVYVMYDYGIRSVIAPSWNQRSSLPPSLLGIEAASAPIAVCSARQSWTASRT